MLISYSAEPVKIALTLIEDIRHRLDDSEKGLTELLLNPVHRIWQMSRMAYADCWNGIGLLLMKLTDCYMSCSRYYKFIFLLWESFEYGRCRTAYSVRY